MINYSYAQSMPATLPISPKIPASLQTPGLLGTLKASHVPVPPNRPSNTTITRDSNSEYSIPSTFVKIDRFSSNYTIAGEISSISASRELITSTIVHDFDKNPNIGYIVYNSSSLIFTQPGLPNPFVNIDTINQKITNETQKRKLTCVIGARGKDGCVIISDTRGTTGSEYKDVSKIRILWNNKGAIACAGDAPLIDNIVETINGISKNRDSDKMVKDLFDENVRSVLARNPPITTQYPPVPMNNPFKAIFIGFQGFDNGDPYIRLIDPRGFSTPIENFEIIGRGAPYVIPLFKLFYDRRLKVNELAVLGYFCIAILISLELYNSVGTRQLGPEAVVLKANDVKLLNRDFLDPDFKTARASSKSID